MPKVPPLWIVIPALNNPEMTETLLADCLAQSIPTRILLILQQVDLSFRDRMEQIAEEELRLLVWSHEPPLPSLAATWNRALKFVWEVGGEEALVLNNDLRIRAETADILRHARRVSGALFVSGVGVTKEQFEAGQPPQTYFTGAGTDLSKGGPDFSCFLITKEAHAIYPFDEGFTPAYCEDLDLHRRMILNGDGDRIFSINLPYWHIDAGSGSLKAMDPIQRRRHEAQIGKSREHYLKKWGGPVNQERFTIPFDATTDQAGVTTPELQAGGRSGFNVPMEPEDEDHATFDDAAADSDALGG